MHAAERCSASLHQAVLSLCSHPAPLASLISMNDLFCAAGPSPHAPPPPPPPAAAPQKRADGRVVATPYAKKLAKDLGVDLNSVAGGPVLLAFESLACAQKSLAAWVKCS